MRFFDYARVASDARIPPDRVQELHELMHGEFPNDEMMCELHVLRACMAIRDGLVSLDDVLQAGAGSSRASEAVS